MCLNTPQTAKAIYNYGPRESPARGSDGDRQGIARRVMRILRFAKLHSTAVHQRVAFAKYIYSQRMWHYIRMLRLHFTMKYTVRDTRTESISSLVFVLDHSCIFVAHIHAFGATKKKSMWTKLCHHSHFGIIFDNFTTSYHLLTHCRHHQHRQLISPCQQREHRRNKHFFILLNAAKLEMVVLALTTTCWFCFSCDTHKNPSLKIGRTKNHNGNEFSVRCSLLLFRPVAIVAKIFR